MPFIGDFNVQNVRSNQRQTKKNIFDVFFSVGSFAILFVLILVSVGTEKRHFYS